MKPRVRIYFNRYGSIWFCPLDQSMWMKDSILKSQNLHWLYSEESVMSIGVGLWAYDLRTWTWYEKWLFKLGKLFKLELT